MQEESNNSYTSHDSDFDQKNNTINCTDCEEELSDLIRDLDSSKEKEKFLESRLQ